MKLSSVSDRVDPLPLSFESSRTGPHVTVIEESPASLSSLTLFFHEFAALDDPYETFSAELLEVWLRSF